MINVFSKGISQEEAEKYVAVEKALWDKEGKELGMVELSIDDKDPDYVLLTASERSPITRVRRITGYLSVSTSFNDSKAAELKDRVKHIK